MSEFNTSFPGVRQIQTYIKDKQEVEIQLNLGQPLNGTIIWQDNDCLCITDEKQQKILIWKQALVYLKAKG